MVYSAYMAKKRKTRKEKITAKLRRELKEAKRELNRIKEKKVKKPKKEAETPKPFSSSLPARIAPMNIGADGYSLSSSLYLKRDLTKTLTLSILAIGVELVIYWLTTKGIGI